MKGVKFTESKMPKGIKKDIIKHEEKEIKERKKAAHEDKELINKVKKS